MPHSKRSSRSVEGDHLRQLKEAGAESDLMECRLAYMELEGIARYVRKLATLKCLRCRHDAPKHRTIGRIVGGGGLLRHLPPQEEQERIISPNSTDSARNDRPRCDVLGSRDTKDESIQEWQISTKRQEGMDHTSLGGSSGWVDDDALYALGATETSQDSERPHRMAKDAQQSWCDCCNLGQPQTRIFPHMLPTQASGRWSTTKPPLVNFPAHAEDDCDRCQALKARGEALPAWCPRAVREVILPDPNWYFVHFDLNAIEGRWAAADSGDEEELEAYRKNEDVHTVLGAVPMFNMPAPPLRTKALHTAPECADWRASWTPPWGGSDDRRRHLAKTLKYATLYGKDHKGAGTAKGVEKLRNSDGSKMTKADVERFAKKYLLSKPILTSHKARRFEQYARDSVSYTFRGRRRRLFGDPWTRAKEGWSHRLQGAVPDIMNDYIIQIAKAFPQGYIVLNSHDGLTWAMPQEVPWANTIFTMKQIVEREWDYEGRRVPIDADWEVIFPDGIKRKVRG